ncbi:hypothetical protein ACNQR7_01655 [Mycolicibacterium senegalense]|uniref:hypothetical protein n=1 Tax=Mycolicibacterium TaxID=1866885 RepID=UPI003204BF40
MSLPGDAAGDDDAAEGALPDRRRWLTWVLGATSVILAAALVVVASILAGRSGDAAAGDPVQEASSAGTGARPASAGDVGPASIVVEDPTCPEWTRISAALTEVQHRVMWFDRDGAIPAVEWTPEQAKMYSTVATALGSVAVQARSLSRATPHRVMREAYEQVIAYVQEQINRIPHYQAADISVARATDSLVGAVTSMCAAAMSGSAQARAPLTPAVSPPTSIKDADEISRRILMADNSSICAEWVPMSANYQSGVAAFNAADWQSPAAEWTYDQHYLTETAVPLINQFADESEQLSRRSNNPAAEDLAVLSAQYLRAYVQALPTYVPADRALADTAAYLTKAVDNACAAVV